MRFMLFALVQSVLILPSTGKMMTRDEKQMISQLKEYLRCYNLDNPNDCFTQIAFVDTCFMPPTEPADCGKDKVIDLFDRHLKAGCTGAVTKTRAVETYGNIRILEVYYICGRSRNAPLESGKGLFVWQREMKTYSWKINYHIWNEKH